MYQPVITYYWRMFISMPGTLILAIPQKLLYVKKKNLMCISFLSLFFPYVFFFLTSYSQTMFTIYSILNHFLQIYIMFIIVVQKFHQGIIPLFT